MAPRQEAKKAMPIQNKEDIRILVIDDEAGVRKMLSHELKMQGFQVKTASDGLEAMEMIKNEKFNLAISDVKMPKMDGVATLEGIKKIDPDLEVIMATGYGTIETAVSAMKKGAYDFVQKPFNLDEIFTLIERALEKSELRALIGIYESTKAIFSAVKLESLLEIVMDLIQKVIKADEGSIMLLDADNKLYIAGSRGIPDEVVKNVHLKIGERIAGFVAKEKRELLLINGLEGYADFKGIESNERIRSSIVCPLLYQGELLGVLNLNRTSNNDHFTKSDLRNASIFAGQVAQAVQNAHLYRALESKVEELKKAYQDLENVKDEMIQSEKLASVGRLMSGVAHELNNPLTSVIGYAQLLLETEVSGETREQLKIIYDEGERCRKIIQNLLAFSRKRKPKKELIDVAVVVDEAIKLVSMETKRLGIQVETKFPENNPQVFSDAHQLRQVFLNLLTNAIHELDNQKGARSIHISAEEKGSLYRLIFCDNGPGIPAEFLNKIFDPFFTTKDVGKGTGLGLSLCYGVISENGGKLAVKSDLGKGASFIVDLPIATEEDRASAEGDMGRNAPAASVRDAMKDIKSVLLIEDEPAISKLLQQILSTAGCHFTSALDGDAAYALLQKRQYDLIISDYRLPKMDGRTLYEKIRSEKPECSKRFIFLTGSAFNNELDQFFKKHSIPNLKKPFTKESLLALITQWAQSLSRDLSHYPAKEDGSDEHRTQG